MDTETVLFPSFITPLFIVPPLRMGFLLKANWLEGPFVPLLTEWGNLKTTFTLWKQPTSKIMKKKINSKTTKHIVSWSQAKVYFMHAEGEEGYTDYISL